MSHAIVAPSSEHLLRLFTRLPAALRCMGCGLVVLALVAALPVVSAPCPAPDMDGCRCCDHDADDVGMAGPELRRQPCCTGRTDADAGPALATVEAPAPDRAVASAPVAFVTAEVVRREAPAFEPRGPPPRWGPRLHLLHRSLLL
ncbi:MAG: hypothetical protein D6705_13125 [Deltaproteobacteria bacterium]|nr:MAG: hypothetical protein D6705_13125 [Deltaproteobacteria bacterium]